MPSSVLETPKGPCPPLDAWILAGGHFAVSKSLEEFIFNIFYLVSDEVLAARAAQSNAYRYVESVRRNGFRWADLNPVATEEELRTRSVRGSIYPLSISEVGTCGIGCGISVFLQVAFLPQYKILPFLKKLIKVGWELVDFQHFEPCLSKHF